MDPSNAETWRTVANAETMRYYVYKEKYYVFVWTSNWVQTHSQQLAAGRLGMCQFRAEDYEDTATQARFDNHGEV